MHFLFYNKGQNVCLQNEWPSRIKIIYRHLPNLREEVLVEIHITFVTILQT